MKDINSIAKEVTKASMIDYDDLPRYDLFLSQAIDYLKDKFPEEKYTSSIVQNYIKSGVVIKPESGKKRGYTKTHLAQLVLLSYMRPILTTEEIKKVFALAFKDISNEDDDILTWEVAFKMLSSLQQENSENILELRNLNMNKLKNIIKENNVGKEDEDRITIFLMVMSLIIQATAIKKLVQKIVDEAAEN